MPKKVNCCVPNCTNNFRNSGELQYYRIPSDRAIRKEYVRLLRNDNLKLNSENTRICSVHFEGGKKRDRYHLPSLFPWSKEKTQRRELKRTMTDQTADSTDNRKKSRSTDSIHEPHEEHLEPWEAEESVYVEAGAQTDFSEHTEIGKESLFVEVGTQTDSFEDPEIGRLRIKMSELQEQIQSLNVELARTKYKMENAQFDIDEFKDKPKEIAFYTGFYDYETLMLCYDIVKESAVNLNYGSYERKTCHSQQGRPRKLNTWQEFIMVLVKLRLGLFNKDLSHRFRVAESVVSEVFRTWIRFLRCELEILIQLPPREVIKSHMPSLFKEYYPDTAIVIDCTEIEMERPSALDNQSSCYSSYKSRTTMKALVGITPSGATAFVSELYPGSTSDKEITVKSGLLDCLEKGDAVMADKGFKSIKDDLVSVGAELIIPSFLDSRTQFSKEEADINKKVACLRVHVERCMERIKNWHILDSKIPISLAPFASDIFIVISAFTNFQPPLIS